MNTVELLMSADVEKFSDKPHATIEIPRLSEKFGQTFTVELEAMSSKKYTELSGRMLDSNNKLDTSKVADTYALITIEGMAEPNLKDPALQEHFGCKTPKDLANKLFNGGELTAMAEKIGDLSGYGEDTIREVKNS